MNPPLFEEHRADLHKSGLSDESIAAMRCRSLDPGELTAALGYTLDGVKSALALPYLDDTISSLASPPSPFTRYKLFPPVHDRDGKDRMRYAQPKDSGVHLYVLPVVGAVFPNTNIRLYWTEGEKKAARATQDGFHCAGLGGLWNWVEAGTAQGITELDAIVHVERDEIIVPDSDVWARPDLLRAVFAFGRELEAHGARVSVVILPSSDGGKIGVDDFLVAKGADAFRKLESIPLKHPAFTKQREWYPGWKAARTKKAAEGTPQRQGKGLTLTDPEPWPEPVDGAVLVDKLTGTFQRFVVLPSGAAVLLALWVVLSYVLDAFDVAPILAITSPQPECGKSTLLAVLAATVRRALPAANISPAAVYRTIEVVAPTLLIDEADSFLADNNELRGVLNSGHTRPTAFVIRCTGDDHEPRRFGTFCLKALAAIGNLPTTLTSRSIAIRLRRRTSNERIDALNGGSAEHEFQALRRQAARWATDHLSALGTLNPQLDAINRLADNLRPLLAIAEEAGGEWPVRARKAAADLENKNDGDDLRQQLLSDIRDLFEAHKTDRLASETIVTELVKLEHRPWPEMGRQGKALTKRGLATLLRPFGIMPKTVRLGPTETPKGYDRADFADAFARYLPAVNATTPQPAPAQENVEFSHPPQAGECGGSEKATSPYSDKVCGAVADKRQVIVL